MESPPLRNGRPRSRSRSPRSRSGIPSTMDLDRRISDEDIRNDSTLYNCNAREAINITIVYSAEDLLPHRAQRSFKPKMTHQVFGYSEQIFGYRKLEINLYFLAHSAQCYVDVKYNGVISNQNGPFPDDVVEQLTPWLPTNFTTDKEYFLSTFLQSEKPTKLFGTAIETFYAHNPSENQTYDYIVTRSTRHTEGFLEFHKRYESLIVWHIDAASRIELTDRRWTYFYLYEQRPQADNEPCGFFPIGFCSMYKYQVDDNTRRARISQFYIMPPCQRYGLGSRLLNIVRMQICQMRRIVDMTVEDPCPEFVYMRDMQDCRLLMRLDCFKYPAITSGFTLEMLNESQKRFKIHKYQCRRVYDILRMSYMMSTGDLELYEEFCDDVVEFQKNPCLPESHEVLKLQKNGTPRRKVISVNSKNQSEYIKMLKFMGSKVNEKWAR